MRFGKFLLNAKCLTHTVKRFYFTDDALMLVIMQNLLKMISSCCLSSLLFQLGKSLWCLLSMFTYLIKWTYNTACKNCCSHSLTYSPFTVISMNSSTQAWKYIHVNYYPLCRCWYAISRPTLLGNSNSILPGAKRKNVIPNYLLMIHYWALYKQRQAIKTIII